MGLYAAPELVLQHSLLTCDNSSRSRFRLQELDHLLGEDTIIATRKSLLGKLDGLFILMAAIYGLSHLSRPFVEPPMANITHLPEDDMDPFLPTNISCHFAWSLETLYHICGKS